MRKKQKWTGKNGDEQKNQLNKRNKYVCKFMKRAQSI